MMTGLSDESPLEPAVKRLYDDLPPHPDHPAVGHIHPHVGSAFRAEGHRALRVAAIGINAYVSDPANPTSPSWFPGWVASRSWRFYKGISRECAALADALEDSGGFAGLRYHGDVEDPSPLYSTNLVKRYLPKDEGQRADQVRQCWVDEGARVWRSELELMHEHGALPHLIVVFGRLAWRPLWRSLGDTGRPPWVERYESCGRKSRLFHHLNRVHVRDKGAASPRLLLLARLGHPAARARRWTARTLAADPDFLAAAGAASTEGP